MSRADHRTFPFCCGELVAVTLVALMTNFATVDVPTRPRVRKSTRDWR
jgi:hypothetical protein